ncbi:helix-turn-helix domain protein [Desulfovibrio sp. X2]|uniref:helix-turn-helix domain-containing protein n=1 Tax=Desulfovibrio sp. X2 TaxID=941449 RepID=UPI000358ADF8|nr:helix-turn-helix domain-containing protein [Desulfovibrio sp. X2]EPR43449.1 helix-turn-helix domain protein [Desulfovibrio sp. X2]
MKNAQQKLHEEFGLYLRLVRTKKRRSMNDIAGKLGFTNTNFISRIERGEAPIPMDRILQFAEAYGLPENEFFRLAVATTHPDIYEAFINLLKHDEEMAKAAARCHSTRDQTKRETQEALLHPGLKSAALKTMRDFMRDNQDLLPKGKQSKRPHFTKVDE